ncbi:type I methionyl aminopeptidase [Desulfuromonas thiophila]|uniref:type I methionyl aminopeptidase n=1 Tax=Desulfuromonas thiophila TaxID=57664 RepID=UPI0024A97DFA|nr:type I methionyl aminopeptidase [Desulfuromonas thiophila]
MIIIKTASEIERMRVPCRMVAEYLAELGELVRPGITTWELSERAEQRCREWKAIPAFKGYGGFPCAICASPDEVVVHGFATQKPLEEGEIVSIDFGVLYDGFYGDAAVTLPVGQVSSAKRRLMAVTQEALAAGIARVLPGGRLTDVSAAVQQVAEAAGYSVVREFVGHGIGRALHEEPQIPNYGRPGQGPVLKEGMVLAIEPMINMGKPQVEILKDGWTAVTRDRKPSAHFEHTVLVTKDGAEILTQL